MQELNQELSLNFILQCNLSYLEFVMLNHLDASQSLYIVCLT